MTEEESEKKHIYLSSTQIDSFHQCPLKWKYRYVDKIYGESTSAMVTGTFVHSVFENLYQIDKNERTVESAKVIARMQWDMLVETDEFKAFELEEPEQKAFRINSWYLIKRLWELENPQFVDVLDVEMRLEFDVCEGVKLIGFIDRIDKTDKGLDIVDYKSGKRPSKWYEADKVKQIYLYALGVEKLLDSPMGKGKLLFLGGDDPGILSRNITQNVLDKTEKKLLEDALAITHARTTLNVEPNVGPLCGWCEYAGLCDAGLEYVIGRMQEGNFRDDAPTVDLLKGLAEYEGVPLPW